MDKLGFSSLTAAASSISEAVTYSGSFVIGGVKSGAERVSQLAGWSLPYVGSIVGGAGAPVEEVIDPKREIKDFLILCEQYDAVFPPVDRFYQKMDCLKREGLYIGDQEIIGDTVDMYFKSKGFDKMSEWGFSPDTIIEQWNSVRVKQGLESEAMIFDLAINKIITAIDTGQMIDDFEKMAIGVIEGQKSDVVILYEIVKKGFGKGGEESHVKAKNTLLKLLGQVRSTPDQHNKLDRLISFLRSRVELLQAAK